MSVSVAAVSRADLLRLWQRAGAGATADRIARLLGFEEVCAPALSRPVLEFTTVASASPMEPAREVEPAPPMPALQIPLFAITHCEPIEPSPEIATSHEVLRPLELADCRPRKLGRPPLIPLVRAQLLWPVLRRSLCVEREGGVDTQRLVANLARNESPTQLPRQRSTRWSEELHVIWDRGERMAPYLRDYQALFESIRAMRGGAGLTLWNVHERPTQVLAAWRFDAKPTLLTKGCTIATRGPGARVLILSDLGALAENFWTADCWREFALAQRRAGAEVVTWVPHSGRQVEVSTARTIHLYCLDQASRLRRQQGRLHTQAQRAAELERLLTLREGLLARVACCVRVEPELLRRLRRIDSSTMTEPALEALYWSHHTVIRASEISRPLAPTEWQLLYRERFKHLPVAQQQLILRCMQEIHAWQGRSTEMLEALIWDSHAAPAAKEDTVTRAAIRAAQEWYNCLVLATPQSGFDAEFAADLLARNEADFEFQRQYSPMLSRLLVRSGRDENPAGLNSLDVARALHLDAPEQEYEVLQSEWQLLLWPRSKKRPTFAAARLGLPWNMTGLQLTVPLSVRSAMVVPKGEPTRLVLLCDEPQCSIFVNARRYDIAPIQRPAWAHELGRDEFGLYMDVRIATQYGSAEQRFRWIEPGTFRMGSAEGELQRHSDEGPQHLVTLTNGFWLADSACTLAMWMVVMGSNSHAPDLGLPMDHVSWEEAQRFLNQWEQLLPGCVPALPTEAQWEYACRAGTQTPFSFGASVAFEQANYDGTHGAGKNGEYRGRPVAVKSLPPNPWGLYEMHGNVLEWCADGHRHYRSKDEVDPTGPLQASARVLRGGSWIDNRNSLRSACRHRDKSGLGVGAGLRVCLMSVKFTSEAERRTTPASDIL